MSSPSSLFSEPEPAEGEAGEVVASRSTPNIPGLYIFPGLLPADTSRRVLEDIAQADYFSGGTQDQVMLFSRAPSDADANLSDPSSRASTSSNLGLPPHLVRLVEELKSLLNDRIPEEILRVVFDQPLARQAIFNLYNPGQGISPHVDLPHRYADGIVGVSLIGGATMTFRRPSEGGRGGFEVYLPPRSIYILTKEARWEWEHGIEGRTEDLVMRMGEHGGEVETLIRELRVSVTFRWMKHGGDVLR